MFRRNSTTSKFATFFISLTVIILTGIIVFNGIVAEAATGTTDSVSTITTANYGHPTGVSVQSGSTGNFSTKFSDSTTEQKSGIIIYGK